MKRPTLVRPPSGHELALLPRAFAVLAAIFLVGSVALATLLPADILLSQVLDAMQAVRPDHLQRLVIGTFGRFAWTSIAVPLLMRPVWMVPVCLGLICIGGAVTTLGPTAPRTKQRRS